MLISILLPSGEKLEQSFMQSRPIVIGRSSRCDFVVHSDSLSRSHCQVEIDNGEVFVTDLNSSNGVFINGERIQPNVKTRFDIFFQLALGPLDCTICLDEPSSPHISPPPKVSNSPTALQLEITETKKSINRTKFKTDSSSRQRSKKPDPKATGIDIKKIFIIMPVVLIAIYYSAFREEPAPQETVVEEAQPSQTETSSNTVQSAAAPAEDAFASPASYLEKKGRKNLTEAKEIVQTLGLRDNDGVVLEGGEVFIFLNPARFLENPNLSEIAQIPEAQDIFAIYEILKSPIMDDLQSGKLSQIHLLVQNPEGSVKKIYRLHRRNFPVESNTKMDIINETGRFLQHKTPQLYWEAVSKKIPSQQATDL
jgi:hypothetical protein